MLSPDVVNGPKESGAVLLAAGDEQVVPQRVEFVSAEHKREKTEREGHARNQFGACRRHEQTRSAARSAKHKRKRVRDFVKRQSSRGKRDQSPLQSQREGGCATSVNLRHTEISGTVSHRRLYMMVLSRL